MKYFIYFFTIVLLLGINVGLFSFLKIAGVVPNLLLLLVLLFALDREGDDFLFLAFLSGIFLDFFSGTFIGSYSLALLLMAVLFRYLLGRILVLDINWKFLAASVVGAAVFVAVFVRLFGLLAFKLGWWGVNIGFEGFWVKTVMESIYNLLLLYPVYYLARLIKHVNTKLLAKQQKLN